MKKILILSIAFISITSLTSAQNEGPSKRETFDFIVEFMDNRTGIFYDGNVQVSQSVTASNFQNLTITQQEKLTDKRICYFEKTFSLYDVQSVSIGYKKLNVFLKKGSKRTNCTSGAANYKTSVLIVELEIGSLSESELKKIDKAFKHMIKLLDNSNGLFDD